ncbi:MAG: hypothetical protein KatS3mg111_2501 [Pirellulaceae bacterium]|nr:MAG: hypothetical protein KatS3mg111_2501 [Pirellulaceae bacterium]
MRSETASMRAQFRSLFPDTKYLNRRASIRPDGHQNLLVAGTPHRPTPSLPFRFVDQAASLAGGQRTRVGAVLDSPVLGALQRSRRSVDCAALTRCNLARGNPVRIRDCPAAVCGNESRISMALAWLTSWEAAVSRWKRVGCNSVPTSPKTCRAKEPGNGCRAVNVRTF